MQAGPNHVCSSSPGAGYAAEDSSSLDCAGCPARCKAAAPQPRYELIGSVRRQMDSDLMLLLAIMAIHLGPCAASPASWSMYCAIRHLFCQCTA